jgi:AcrR family transcriptional regulator
MTGLRERSKRRRRDAVLAAAERLIREQGYTQTTIEEIAGEAEVSVGALYSYFGSKGGLLRELMQPMIEEMQRKAARVIANPPERPVDAIAAMYEAYRFTDEWRSLNFLSGLGPDARDGDTAIEDIRKMFAEFIGRQFHELLGKLIEQGKVSAALDLNDAEFILFEFLESHFNSYVRARGAMSHEEMIVSIHRRLRALFELCKPLS